MNNLHLYFKMVAIVLSGLFFQSCLNNNDDYSNFNIGTVKFADEDPSSLYFELDFSQNLYPNALNFLQATELKNKDRVFIEYKNATENKSDFYADIIGVLPLKTKDIHINEDKDNLESLLEKSAKINISEVYIVNGFITLKYTYIGGNVNLDEHELELYALSDIQQPEGSLYLYLTHDSKNDQGLYQRSGIITFPMDNIEDLLNQSSQIFIKSHTVYNGIEEHLIKVSDIH